MDAIIKTFFDFEIMAGVVPSLILIGLKNTVVLAGGATIIGLFLGLLLAMMAVSKNAGCVGLRAFTSTCSGAFPRSSRSSS